MIFDLRQEVRRLRFQRNMYAVAFGVVCLATAVSDTVIF